MNAPAWVSSSHRPMGFSEFVIVIASIMALNPLAMDMMLPALPNIGTAFHIAAANRPQMVLSIFLLGFGVGQFVMGPLSDRFGRRPILLGGMAVYCVASLLAIGAPSFETLLLARAAGRWDIRHARHSCGSRANEVGVYSLSLSEPRLRFGWFALQPTSCRLSARQELKRWPMLNRSCGRTSHRRRMPIPFLAR